MLGVSCNILYSCKREKKEMPVNNISQNNIYKNVDNTKGNNHDNNILPATENSPISSDSFFEGKNADINRLDIDTTKTIIDANSLSDKEWEEAITDVNTIIIKGKKEPFKEYISTCVNAIFPLPSYLGYKVFIIFFEYGDSEYWEMCISDKGIIDAKSQTMVVRYTWDDLGAENENNADYSTIDFQIYPNYIICLKGKERKKGKIKERIRYYHITSKGKFEELK